MITVSHHHPLIIAAWIVSTFWTRKKFARKLLSSFFFPSFALCVCGIRGFWGVRHNWSHLSKVSRHDRLRRLFLSPLTTRKSWRLPQKSIPIFWVMRYPLRVSIYLNTKRKARSGSLTELKQPSLYLLVLKVSPIWWLLLFSFFFL